MSDFPKPLQQQHQQMYLDALDGLLADAAPRLARVHELRVLDLVLNVDVLVKGKLSAKTDIDDHPSGPHVKGAIEALKIVEPDTVTETQIHGVRDKVMNVMCLKSRFQFGILNFVLAQTDRALSGVLFKKTRLQTVAETPEIHAIKYICFLGKFYS
jgi:hypothetical protein